MKTTTRVALHCFNSDESLPQRDGVNLAHIEINHLLASPPAADLQVEFHDFDRVVRDDGYAREVLAGVDCVLCNVGPHAHYYHELRERLALDFRIVRDVRTALWSCYLLQEALCEPYLRPGDALLALSGYSRELTRRLFPHLAHHPIHLFEPVMAESKRGDVTPAFARRTDVVTLGHIGRLSEDKNFPQMVDLLVELDRREPGRYRLVACGAVHSHECDPELVADRVLAETGRADLFTYIPTMPHEDVLHLFGTFDYFLFFTTSNLETLGRVLVEAAYAKVPVLASNHAAAAENLDRSSLFGVTYARNRPFYSHFDAPLGTIDVAAVADRIQRGEVPAPPPAAAINDVHTLIEVLRGFACDTSMAAPDQLDPAPAEFIAHLRWTDMPRFATRAQVDPVMAELRDWFCALNGRKSVDFEHRLEELERRSRFPERTLRFIRTTGRTLCDFSNLGGMDMELCNIAGFHPHFWLAVL